MARSQHIDMLNAFSINGVRPFCGSGGDIAFEALASAHALTLMFSDAVDPDPASEKGAVNSNVLRASFEAIGQLIALALFAEHGGPL